MRRNSFLQLVQVLWDVRHRLSLLSYNPWSWLNVCDKCQHLFVLHMKCSPWCEMRCEREASLDGCGNSCCVEATLLTWSLTLCPYRGTWWTKRGGLSPRPVLHGSWTPRNPSAPSALSTRLPYSKVTLPPRPRGSGLTCPSSPPPMCLSLWLGLLCAGHPLLLLSLTQPVTVSQWLVLLFNHSFHALSWIQVTLFHLVTFVWAKSHCSLVPSCILSCPSSLLSSCQRSYMFLSVNLLFLSRCIRRRPLWRLFALFFHLLTTQRSDKTRLATPESRPQHVLYLDAQVVQRKLWSCSCTSMHPPGFSRLSLCSGMQLF